MCKAKRYKKIPNTRIDKCMRLLIDWFKRNEYYTIVACCCGHGKYPMTIVVKTKDIAKYTKNKYFYWDLFSRTHIPRKRKFYKRDKQGYYYIPEVVNNGK